MSTRHAAADIYDAPTDLGPRDGRLTGIVPPMVTPLSDRDTLDVAGLERLIEHILAGGVHGLFILGTTGEGPSMGPRLKRELIERTCARVKQRVPVLVGVTDTCFSESLSLAGYAADRGADAVVVAPPYYFPAGQPELLEYYVQILDQMPLPVVPYNMPGCTKINIELDTLGQLLEHRNVRAFKDSSRDMIYLHGVVRLLKDYPGKTVLVGPEEMLAETVLLGGHGGVSGGANLFPRLYVDLYESASAGNLHEVQRLHQRVMAVAGTLYGVGRYGSSTIKGIKCALSCMGVCEDRMAEPFHRFETREREVIQQRLVSLSDQPAGERV